MPTVPLRYPDPPLASEHIRLRRWKEGDVDCVRLASMDTRIPHGTTVPSRFNVAEGIAFIHRQWSRAQKGEGLSQAIVEAERDRALGLVWLSVRPQPGVAGLGYWIIPPERGRGVATAAVRLISTWAMDAWNLGRLEAWVEPQNLASQHVLRNAGFSEEGRLRNFLTTGAGVSDAVVFSVIPQER